VGSIRELADQLRRDRIVAAMRMTPEQRLLAGGDLFDAIAERMAAGIRAQYPTATEDEVRSILRDRLVVARRMEHRA